MRSLTFYGVIVVASCSTSSHVPREPEPYQPDIDIEPPSPTLAAPQVVDQLEQRFASLISAVPTGFPDAFGAMMALAEPDCPELVDASTDTRDSRYFRADCTTSAGVRFYGAITYAYDRRHREGDVWAEGLEMFAQDLRITSPDGRFLEANGYFYYEYFDDAYGQWASSYGDGSLWADPITAGDDRWLQGAVDGLVGTFVGDFSGYRLAVVTASVALDDPDIVGVSLDQLQWEPGLCDVELLGSGSIREANGVWHDVTFASWIDDTAEVRGCDGCGAHRAAEVPQDDAACHTDALGSLVDWTGGLPW